MQELGELERRVAGQDVRPTGVVRLTTTETLLDLVAPAVAELRVLHPGIVMEVATADAFLTLTRRDADVALRPAAKAPEHLVARRLASIATAIYAARRYLEGRSAIDPLALEWLAPDDSLAHVGSAQWIEEHVRTDRIVYRASSIPGLRGCAGGNRPGRAALLHG